MVRIAAILAGLLIGSVFAAPASANTIATFALTAFFTDGATGNGTFSLDMTAQTIESVSITTTTGFAVQGGSYPGFAVDTYQSVFMTQLDFFTSATALPPLAGQKLTLLLPFNNPADLMSLPTFEVYGSESVYFFLCGGLCADRALIGKLRTLSVVTSTTPIPASLPLLATALGGMGILGWRQRRAEAPTQAAA